MRFMILFTVLLFWTLFGKAQIPSIENITFRPADTLQGPYKPSASVKHIFIASKFGSSAVDQHRALDSVSGFMIEEIVLVYSRFKKSEQFKQADLNRARWKNLHERYPTLFQSSTTVFRDVCQAGVGSDSVAKELSHGFYIFYENIIDPKERKAEIDAVAAYLSEFGIDSGAVEPPVKADERIEREGAAEGPPRPRKPRKTKDPRACRQPFYQGGNTDLDNFFLRNIELNKRQKRNPEKVKAELQLRIDHNGQIRSAYVLSADKEFIAQIKKALSRMSLWHPAVLNGVSIKTMVRITLQSNPNGFVHVAGPPILPRALAKCGTQSDEDIFEKSGDGGDPKMPGIFEVSDEKLMKKVVERNKSLDSILLVVDLTGSMGPYIAQVLEIMADMVDKNDKRILSIALFNDGNNKPDKAKKVGSTGGIIVLQGDITMEVLGDAVLKSMKRGNGGDVMENNIEAVIQGLSACRGCNHVMLVCDNFATPRDGALLAQVTKPIHWIICGGLGGINVNYLDLARQNKGVVHTGRSDVTNLHEVEENGTVVIDGFRYKLVKGKFRML